MTMNFSMGFKTTNGGKMLCLGPQVVALIIRAILSSTLQTDGRYQVHYLPAPLSYEVDNKGLHYVVIISLRTPIGGFNIIIGPYMDCVTHK